MEAFRNQTPRFNQRALPGPHAYPQLPALAERSRIRIGDFLNRLDTRLSDNDFIAGERFTIADITALVSTDFAARLTLQTSVKLTHLKRWYEAVSARPSAKA